MAQCHIQWLYLAVHGCKTYLNRRTHARESSATGCQWRRRIDAYSPPHRSRLRPTYHLPHYATAEGHLSRRPAGLPRTLPTKHHTPYTPPSTLPPRAPSDHCSGNQETHNSDTYEKYAVYSPRTAPGPLPGTDEGVRQATGKPWRKIHTYIGLVLCTHTRCTSGVTFISSF
jgi:hypothetical protein